MYVCMCVWCVCVCVCVHTYIYTYIFLYTCICMYTPMVLPIGMFREKQGTQWTRNSRCSSPPLTRIRVGTWTRI